MPDADIFEKCIQCFFMAWKKIYNFQFLNEFTRFGILNILIWFEFDSISSFTLNYKNKNRFECIRHASDEIIKPASPLSVFHGFMQVRVEGALATYFRTISKKLQNVLWLNGKSNMTSIENKRTFISWWKNFTEKKNNLYK